MARKETIKYIQEWIKDGHALNGKDRVVLNTALEVLEQEPREDCISREWVLKKFQKNKEKIYKSEYFDELLWLVKHAPNVVPSRVEGKWMPIIEANEFGEAYQSGIYCSECGETLGCEANFCPNCGADMREGAENE